MQKNIINVFLSFSGVIFFVLSGTIIAYRTNIIPDMEDKFEKALEKAIREKNEQTLYAQTLAEELEIAKQNQQKAESRLKEKLAQEERLALEKARKEQEARLAAQKAAAQKMAEEARLAAQKAEKEKKESSKDSYAS